MFRRDLFEISDEEPLGGGRRLRWPSAAGAVAGWAGLLLSLVALTRAEGAAAPLREQPERTKASPDQTRLRRSMSAS
jgi:hypothetical protein